MRRKTRWMALFMAAAMMMTGCGSSGSTDASADTASAAESVSTDTSSAGGTHRAVPQAGRIRRGV